MEATQWLPGRWGVVAWQRSGFMRNRTAFIGNDTSGAGSAGRGRASVRPPIRAGESAGSSGEDGVTAAVAGAGAKRRPGAWRETDVSATRERRGAQARGPGDGRVTAPSGGAMGPSRRGGPPRGR